MKSQFRHVALIGKYHAHGSRSALESIAQFVSAQGCEVAIEQDTANNTGLTQYPILDVAGIGAQCDLGTKVTPRTKGIVVINPNNPTGALY
eukprot:gene52256-63873_t